MIAPRFEVAVKFLTASDEREGSFVSEPLGVKLLTPKFGERQSYLFALPRD